MRRRKKGRPSSFPYAFVALGAAVLAGTLLLWTPAPVLSATILGAGFMAGLIGALLLVGWYLRLREIPKRRSQSLPTNSADYPYENLRQDQQIGEILRQARLDLGLSLEEAARETRIRRSYIQALEDGDAEGLPAPVYVRGFINAYATHLRLDPHSLSRTWTPARAQHESYPSASARTTSSEPIAIRSAADETDPLPQLELARRRFTDRLEHELRQPLQKIIGAAGRMQLAADPKSSVWRDAQVISDTVGDIKTLLDTLHRLSRPSSLLLDMEITDIDELVQRVISGLRDIPEFARREVILQRPSSDGVSVPMHVNADVDLLEKAFVNIFDNALKYSGQDYPVDVLLESVDGQITVSVRDRGLGLPPDDLPWVFTEMFRARNVGRVPGSGLGLNIARDIIHRLGGKLEIANAPDAGTVACVRLPIKTFASREVRYVSN